MRSGLRGHTSRKPKSWSRTLIGISTAAFVSIEANAIHKNDNFSISNS